MNKKYDSVEISDIKSGYTKVDLELSREDILSAISIGVKDSFLTAMEAGDGFSGPIIRDNIMEAITSGIIHGMPYKEDVCIAIRNGVEIALRNREWEK